MTAPPEMRSIRSRIRDQSRWAKRVVIATDTDAAGDAIAYGICRQLNRFKSNLLRTSLRGLTPALIKRCIESARPLDPNGLLQRLKNRYLVNKQLQQIPWSLPDKYILPVLALLSFLFNAHRRKWFIDQDGYRYQMTNGIPMACNEFLNANPSRSTVEKFEIYSPLTTATAIELFEVNTEKQSFESLQDHLNQLFTTLPRSIGQGLISYPRTVSKGFWEDTWSRFRRQWTKTGALETFRPSPIQPTLSERAAHESIYPLELSNTPGQVRPYLSKFQYELYRHVYNYHQKLLSAPATYQARVLETSPDRGKLYAANSQAAPARSPKKLQSYVSIGELVNQMMEYKTLRPSRAGSFMDYILDKGLITRDKYGNVRAGSGLNPLYRDIRSLSALDKLIQYHKSHIDQCIEPEMISKFSDDIF